MKPHIKISIILIVIIIIIIIIKKFITLYEHFQSSLKWSSQKYCYLSETLQNILNEQNIYYTNIDNNWNMYIPCNYESINEEYNSVPKKDGAIYFFIDDADYMIAKEELWKNIVKKYGKPQAITLMPNSYVLDNEENINQFKNEFSDDKIYIMKRNIQRQEGLKITNSLNDILNTIKNDNSNYKYMLIQELLQNPYLISGRKINLRIYVLVVCQGDSMEIYMYNNGFMYYTAKLFVKNSTESGPNITTGYIDRKVYAENPLTHEDFKLYLDNNKRTLTKSESNILYNHGSLSKYTFNNIENLIRKVFISYSDVIGRNKKLFLNKKFQLFGADVAISDDLNAQIMEINKGPDLGAKDKRDSELKHNLVRDIFNIVDIDKNKDKNKNVKTNFIKLN
jgi:hypothetical protein